MRMQVSLQKSVVRIGVPGIWYHLSTKVEGTQPVYETVCCRGAMPQYFTVKDKSGKLKYP